jgi:hypothetical protein
MSDQFAIFKRSTIPAGAETVEVLNSLMDVWVRQWQLGDETAFWNEVVRPIAEDWASDDRGDMVDDDSTPLVAVRNATSMSRLIFQSACIITVQAIRVQQTDVSNDHKWACACQATRMLGMLIGSMGEIDQLSALAKRGASARHSENRAMKATVFEWCEQNFDKYKSLDRAAIAVAGVEVPVVFRTARSWIKEWKDKRSAGTL